MPEAIQNRSRLIGWASLALIVCVALVIFLLAGGGSASAAKVTGAAALPEQPQPQETASVLKPNPKHATADRGPTVTDGCMVGMDGEESGKCLYGDPHGGRAVFLFGDSHAMQYFEPVELVAERRRWRLTVLNKRECSPVLTPVLRFDTDRRYASCDTWRQRSLRRIERSSGPTTVVLSGDNAAIAFVHGHPLSGAANAHAMQRGYQATLKRILRSGATAVVIKDMPSSPENVPRCVNEHRDHLRDCAFPRKREGNLEFDARAARAVPGVGLIDLTPEVCPDGLCRAVIGNALVFRDKRHLTATFARTLSPWIERGLEDAGAR